MKIEINSKYSIGDIVQIYKILGEHKSKIICPLCNGRHFVDNPKYNYYDDDDEDCDDSKLKCPHCDENGYIKTNYVTKRVLSKENYRIEHIFIDIRIDGSIKYIYSLYATPELNNNTPIHISCNASEEDLELAKDYNKVIIN
jgi:hypothetical protein